MKKLIYYLIVLGAAAPGSKITAQAISPTFFAQNYWMTSNSPFNGTLESYWTEIVASGVKYMRIGGISYDNANNVSLRPTASDVS